MPAKKNLRPTNATARKKATRKKTTSSKKATAKASKESGKKVSKKSAAKKSKPEVAPAPANENPVQGMRGTLRKMRAEHAETVEYFLPVGDAGLALNEAIGRTLAIQFEQHIECVHCGRKTSKSFNQGYCFPCLRKLAQCDSCIIKPELCHYHEGTCREPQWGEENCFQPHVVYIANTSGLKVGITRGTQIPTRWIDQGADQAVPMFIARDRRMSGLVEVAMKAQVADKTDFRRMLKGQPESRDMQESMAQIRDNAKEAIANIRKEHGDDAVREPDDDEVRSFSYPVSQWPEKVRSITLDKQPLIRETLTGIKGQYLMFGNVVFNVRRHAGYLVTVAIE